MADISAGWRHRATRAAAFGLLSSVAFALLSLLLFVGPVGAEVASSAGGAPVGLGTPAVGDAGDTKGVDAGTEAQAPSPAPDQAPAPGRAAPATPTPGGHRSADPASVTTVTGPYDGEVQEKAPDLRTLDPHAVAQLEVEGQRGAPAGGATAGAFPMADLPVVGDLATTAAASGRVAADGSSGQVRINIVRVRWPVPAVRLERS